MKENFEKCLSRVLAYEGTYVNNLHDPGGATNEGITQSTYSAWLLIKGRNVRSVKELTEEDRDAIYREQYWDMIQGDLLPVGLDLAVFDAAVNSGVGQSVRWLQNALGIMYQGQIDGVLGSKTLVAIKSFGSMGELIDAMCLRRLATLQHLKTWSTFGKGWSARVANVRKTAVSWVTGAPTPMAPDLSRVGGAVKAKVSGNIRPSIVSQITAHIATAAGSAGTIAAQAAQQIHGLQEIFGWVKYVFGGLTLVTIAAGIFIKFDTDIKANAESGAASVVVDVDPDADTDLPAIPDVAVAKPPVASPKGV